MSAIDKSRPCVLCEVSCRSHANRNDVAPDSLQTPSALSQGAGGSNAEVVWHVIEAATLAFRAEERRRKLREAADQAAETGRDTQVFNDSAYSLGEDAHTPNVHSRQVSAIPQHGTIRQRSLASLALFCSPCPAFRLQLWPLADTAPPGEAASQAAGSRGEVARPAPPQQVPKCTVVCTHLATFSAICV
jgi:hypothetical protein